jgi:hypothetical protein
MAGLYERISSTIDRSGSLRDLRTSWSPSSVTEIPASAAAFKTAVAVIAAPRIATLTKGK